MSEQQHDADLEQLAKLGDSHKRLREQISKIIVGQTKVVDELMISIFARGHCILEGVPGLAKTLMVSTLARCLSLDFARIQFTPDLMPSDITGTEVLHEDRSTGARELRYVKGPVFTNVLLADEINRTPPKTQSSLLEAMQERQVTSGGHRHELPDPFFVLATQNPIEQEGTYPLPEAQLDRFLLKVYVKYPTPEEEHQIYRLTTGMDTPEVEEVLNREEILELQRLVRKLPVSDHCLDYAMSLIRSTRDGEEGRPEYVSRWIAWGAGPRAGQAMILAAKARAALDGRNCVSVEDIREVAAPVMRHRLVLTYAAQAEGQTADTIIDRLLNDIPVREGAAAADGQVAQVFGS